MLNFKVDEFSVGMGPAIFKKKKGETQYSIRILPLGGYCKFEAKMKPTIPIRELFQIKSRGKDCLYFWQAGFLISILGFVLFLVIVPSTSPARTNVIDTVVPHSYIEQVGVQPNDKIIKINGKKINLL